MTFPHAPAQHGAIAFSADAFSLAAEGWTPRFRKPAVYSDLAEFLRKNGINNSCIPQGFSCSRHPARTKDIQGRAYHGVSVQTIGRRPESVCGRRPISRDPCRTCAPKEKVSVWSCAIEIPVCSRPAIRFPERLVYLIRFLACAAIAPPFWVVECPIAAGCFSQKTQLFVSSLRKREIRSSK